MFTTYVLLNSKNGKHYIGSTNNLVRRLNEHNRSQTRSTRQNRKWTIIYSEEYITSKEAKDRERIIKSYKGGNAFKKLLSL
jgi:putative endonuclease